MTETDPIARRGVPTAILFCVGLVAAEALLTLGAAVFFRQMNTDIPPDLLAGMVTDANQDQEGDRAIHARLAWIASVVFVVFVSAGAMIFAVTKVLKEDQPLRGRLLLVMGSLIFVFALIATRSDVSRELLQEPVLIPTIASFPVGGIEIETFAAIRRLANALVAGATVAVVLALAVRSSLGLVMAANRRGRLSIHDRLTDVRQLLVAGALILVSVIITMTAWLNWPTAGLAPDSPAYRTIVEIGEGVGLYWGTVFSLTLVLAYLPCVAYINRIAATAADRTREAEMPVAAAGSRQTKALQDLVALVSPFVSALLPVFLA